MLLCPPPKSEMFPDKDMSLQLKTANPQPSHQCSSYTAQFLHTKHRRHQYCRAQTGRAPSVLAAGEIDKAIDRWPTISDVKFTPLSTIDCDLADPNGSPAPGVPQPRGFPSLGIRQPRSFPYSFGVLQNRGFLWSRVSPARDTPAPVSQVPGSQVSVFAWPGAPFPGMSLPEFLTSGVAQPRFPLCRGWPAP